MNRKKSSYSKSYQDKSILDSILWFVENYLPKKDKKSAHSKNYQDKSILDSILWFVENYLPKKDKKSSEKEFRLDNFESFTINKIKKLASSRSKSLRGDLSNAKVTFTVGNWALPYLYFLKRINVFK